MNSFHDNIMYRKRERTQNWTLEEKMFLLELVKSRLDVLENKRIDSASSAMKGLAWQDIHAGFAARFGSDRDAHRVREQWRRMKGQCRTEMLEFAERVRTYGAEVANQRRPSALAEEVWKTLETARRLNIFHQQSFGAGDDLGSPVNLDDDDDDVEDPMDTDSYLSGALSLNASDGCHRNVNGYKHEAGADLGGGRRNDRVFSNRVEDDASGSHPHGQEVLNGSDNEDEMDRRMSSSGAGLMSMLRPKVELELNDVPELDTSMVPSGLSITAVKMGGGSGSGAPKRRALERLDALGRAGPWGATSGSTGPAGSSGHLHVNPMTSSSSLLESKRLEHRRRLEIMEAEHRAKMELLRVERETAEIRRRIAATDESAALTCRSCGAVREFTQHAVTKRPAVNVTDSCSKSEIDQDHDQDADVDGSSIVTAVSDISRGSPLAPVAAPLLNGGREEDDNNNEEYVTVSLCILRSPILCLSSSKTEALIGFKLWKLST